MSRNVEKCREMSSFENFKKFSETWEKMSSFENFWVSENFDFMHLTARKMIFNANYEEKLTESFQNKRNWVQLGSIGRLRHFPSVCDVSRNVEKCREMSRNVEKCRVLSKSLLGGDLIYGLWERLFHQGCHYGWKGCQGWNFIWFERANWKWLEIHVFLVNPLIFV